MTDEAQGHGPEDTPAPPTSTRWSEDAVPDEDAVPPPFVPGREAAAHTGEPESAAEQAQGPPSEVTREPGTVPEPEPAGEEPFPFDAQEGAEQAVQEEEEERAAESAPAEDDFPFDQFDIEGEGEEATDAVEGEPADMGWTPAELGLEEPREEVPEPELGAGSEPEAVAEPQPEPLSEPFSEPQPEAIPEPYAEPAAPAASAPAPGRDAAEDAAALLDRLAALLRAEGAEAVRREMESSDRLTAVLAGLLAGYVSGRSS